MAEDDFDSHRTIDHDTAEPIATKSAEEKTKVG